MAHAYPVFVDRWTHPDYRPDPTAASVLDVVERELSFVCPIAYREFLEGYGAVSTTSALLEHIVEGELDLSDVSGFLSPADIGAVTMSWRTAGLPEELVAFASDSCGNLYCFHRNDGIERGNDAMVYFFDHDFGECDCLEISFRDWIRTYAEL